MTNEMTVRRNFRGNIRKPLICTGAIAGVMATMAACGNLQTSNDEPELPGAYPTATASVPHKPAIRRAKPTATAPPTPLPSPSPTVQRRTAITGPTSAPTSPGINVELPHIPQPAVPGNNPTKLPQIWLSPGACQYIAYNGMVNCRVKKTGIYELVKHGDSIDETRGKAGSGITLRDGPVSTLDCTILSVTFTPDGITRSQQIAAFDTCHRPIYAPVHPPNPDKPY